LVEEDAEALGCEEEVERAKEIANKGNAADQQRRVYSVARSSGADHDTALGAVVSHLIEEFHADL
jgi:carboxylate-amine ligase